MKKYFSDICQIICDQCQNNDFFMAGLNAESSNFVRFNHAKIRQASHVEQATLSLTWIRSGKQMVANCDLSRNIDTDRQTLLATIKRLKTDIDYLTEDPYLLYQSKPFNTMQECKPSDNHIDTVCMDVLALSKGLDMVGLLTQGQQQIGFANSLGQSNWSSFDDINIDWSIYLGASASSDGRQDKAAKGNFVCQTWSQDNFNKSLNKTVSEAKLMERPAKKLHRGEYRAYLTPTALAEIIRFADFGEQRWRNKVNLLQQLHDSEKNLSHKLSIHQNPELGLSANFQGQGFISDKLNLVRKGKAAEKLISPRSAKEYDIEHNGANDGETTGNLEVSPGQLTEADILQTLGTGLFINNLHYVNISDRYSARLTGMTRFATFWVEDGELVAPVDVLRFDDSLYKMLGGNLLELSQHRQAVLNDSTYMQRGRGGVLLPGALLCAMQFTL